MKKCIHVTAVRALAATEGVILVPLVMATTILEMTGPRSISTAAAYITDAVHTGFAYISHHLQR